MSTPNYYYRDPAGREIGPLPFPALAQLRQGGVLGDHTPVRAENHAEWVECRQVIVLAPAPAAPAREVNEGGNGNSSKQHLVWAAGLVVVVGILAAFHWWPRSPIDSRMLGPWKVTNVNLNNKLIGVFNFSTDPAVLGLMLRPET